MDSSADAALINTTAGGLGYWFGGFIIPMIIGYILLRFAGSPKRKPAIALVLRVLAVVVAALLVFAGYIGGGGQLNPGGLLALIIVTAWAIKQQSLASQQPPNNSFKPTPLRGAA